jgi:hypothetical protein
MRNLAQEMNGSLSVRGTDNLKIPKEILNWYAGKGTPLLISDLEDYYNMKGNLRIVPSGEKYD